MSKKKTIQYPAIIVIAIIIELIIKNTLLSKKLISKYGCRKNLDDFYWYLNDQLNIDIYRFSAILKSIIKHDAVNKKCRNFS
mgnify:CR=1 FL=1